MNTLAERTIEAHGGLKRWNELESVTAHLDEGGALWGLKGHPSMVGETNVTVGTRSEWASHYPFLAARADQVRATQSRARKREWRTDRRVEGASRLVHRLWFGDAVEQAAARLNRHSSHP
jgi:hypothetical protein